MVRLVILLLVVVAAVVVSFQLFPGEDTYESVVRKSVETVEEAAELLEGIQDADDAREAAPRLDALMERLRELMRKGEDLPEPTSDEKVRVTEKYRDRFAAAGARWGKATVALATKPGALLVLSTRLEAFGRLLRQ